MSILNVTNYICRECNKILLKQIGHYILLNDFLALLKYVSNVILKKHDQIVEKTM